MVSSILEVKSRRPESLLAMAVYPRDLLPTRDRTLDYKSVFTYKDCVSGERFPTESHRGRLQPFARTVFGLVDDVFPLEEENVLILHLVCPSTADADYMSLFVSQVTLLKTIIRDDCAGRNDLITSWFNPRWGDTLLCNIEDGFYLLLDCGDTVSFNFYAGAVVGKEVMATVQLKKLVSTSAGCPETEFMMTTRGVGYCRA
ncbi:hypothetical protein C8R43DRAFT_947443 [Mycena crocata]|nr:hypothetical protein C8R43DRAFT_961912 [Mycena crocata]KAJ7161951.1 hypothetical protein C8R43DRAFT_947443 [Mycena crocata]